MTSRNPKSPRPTPATPKARQPFSSQDGRSLELIQAQAAIETSETDLTSAKTLLQRVKDDPSFRSLSEPLQTDIDTFLGVSK